DLVGGTCSGRRTVGDVNAWRGRQVAPGTRDAVHRVASEHRVEDAGRMDSEQLPADLEGRAAVEGAGLEDRLLLRILVETVPEQIDGAGAVGPHGASCPSGRQRPLARRRVRVRLNDDPGPGVTAVGGPGHGQ